MKGTVKLSLRAVQAVKVPQSRQKVSADGVVGSCIWTTPETGVIAIHHVPLLYKSPSGNYAGSMRKLVLTEVLTIPYNDNRN